jgi:16S rRNA (adenine1518-N6/adenine1519-N6)-dimethyltransferase
MIQPRKQFAQHWLKSDKALNAIVQAANCQETDKVLEIGPGTGILTRRLLPLVKSLLAVEIDRDLCKLLAKQMGEKENFLLLQGDFLTLDLPSQLTAFANFQKQNKVVANIP